MNINISDIKFNKLVLPNNQTICYFSEEGKNMLCHMLNITLVDERETIAETIRKIVYPALITLPFAIIFKSLFFKPKEIIVEKRVYIPLSPETKPLPHIIPQKNTSQPIFHGKKHKIVNINYT